MKRVQWLAGALALVGIAVSSTVLAADAPLTPVTIAIAVDGFQYTPLYVARAKGYFKAEGLDVELLPSGGGAKGMTAVLAGSANALAAVASEVINADNHGQDVQIFAALLDKPEMSVVIQKDVAERLGVTADSPLDKRLAALRGLKLGVSSAKSASDAIIHVLLAQAHLDATRDAEIIPTGGAANQVAAFMAHKVDGAVATSPTPEEVIARAGGVELFNVGNGDVPLYRSYPWTVLSARHDWLDANPRVVGGLIRAFAKAQAFIHQDFDGTVKIMRAVFPRIDDGAFLAACKRNFPSVAAGPAVHLDAIATAFDEFKLLSTDKLNVTPDQIASNRYVEAALK
jgi:NitT/TauT family transport system substrate-binding protein